MIKVEIECKKKNQTKKIDIKNSNKKIKKNMIRKKLSRVKLPKKNIL
jgi:hypothetical protein